MDIEDFCRALPTQRSIWLKAHKQIHFGTMNIKEKDYKQILFLDLKAQGFIKSSQHKTCRSIYKEHNIIGLVFFFDFSTNY